MGSFGLSPLSAVLTRPLFSFCQWSVRLFVAMGQTFDYKYVRIHSNGFEEGKLMRAVASSTIVIIDDTSSEVKKLILAILCPPKANIVKLNVGGTTFTTSTTVLRTVPSSRLAEVLIDFKPEADTPVFLDRDPEVFAHILRWLRTGIAPPVDEVDGFERLLLVAEAEFWGLTPLLITLTAGQSR